MRLRPLVRDRTIIDLFEEAGGNAERASTMFHDLLSKWPDDEGLLRQVLLCEQEGDRIAHDLIHHLYRSYSGGIDRSDGLALIGAIDDVVDYVEEAADFLVLYRVEAPMEQAQQLSAILRDASRALGRALAELARPKRMAPHLVEVNRLENEGDQIVRAALASLFHGGIDPMVVIRWKDVFERIEAAIDACETAAHVLEGIAIKNA